jgi:hypothetical protein
MRVRGLYINTHAGEAIREGGLAWAKREYQADLTVLVEVGRRPAQRRVIDLYPRERFSITGLGPPDQHLEVKSGTLIIARRANLRRVWSENTLLTQQRWLDGQRDKWHPVRRLTRARYVFADNRDVDFEVGADHAWSYAGHRLFSSHEVPTEHRKQIQAYARKMRAASAEHRACLDVGDMNERTSAQPNHVERAFHQAGAETLVAHKLEYLFGNEQVELVDHDVIPAHRVHTDHDGIVFELKVRGR